MKKFTKIALVLATIFFIIGLFCIIGSVALGLTWGTFGDMVRAGKFSFDIGDVGYIGFGDSGSDYAEIEETFSNLDIELGAGTLEIYYSDVEKVQIEQEGVSNFKYYIDDDTLHVDGKPKWGIGDSDGSIVIVIPKEMAFQEVDLEIGAGEADVEGLLAQTANIEVGAGEANITNLDVKELKAETGAGQLYVELIGAEENYNYDLECGIGEIEIGNNSYGGLGREQSITNPGAERFLDIECGVGEIQIEFKNNQL